VYKQETVCATKRGKSGKIFAYLADYKNGRFARCEKLRLIPIFAHGDKGLIEQLMRRIPQGLEWFDKVLCSFRRRSDSSTKDVFKEFCSVYGFIFHTYSQLLSFYATERLRADLAFTYGH
jgi:hypothetical protein